MNWGPIEEEEEIETDLGQGVVTGFLVLPGKSSFPPSGSSASSGKKTRKINFFGRPFLGYELTLLNATVLHSCLARKIKIYFYFRTIQCGQLKADLQLKQQFDQLLLK